MQWRLLAEPDLLACVADAISPQASDVMLEPVCTADPRSLCCHPPVGPSLSSLTKKSHLPFVTSLEPRLSDHDHGKVPFATDATAQSSHPSVVSHI